MSDEIERLQAQIDALKDKKAEDARAIGPLKADAHILLDGEARLMVAEASSAAADMIRRFACNGEAKRGPLYMHWLDGKITGDTLPGDMFDRICEAAQGRVGLCATTGKLLHTPAGARKLPQAIRTESNTAASAGRPTITGVRRPQSASRHAQSFDGGDQGAILDRNPGSERGLEAGSVWHRPCDPKPVYRV